MTQSLPEKERMRECLCGKTPARVIQMREYDDHDTYTQYRVGCACGVEGPIKFAEDAAIKAWNTRPQPPAGNGEVADAVNVVQKWVDNPDSGIAPHKKVYLTTLIEEAKGAQKLRALLDTDAAVERILHMTDDQMKALAQLQGECLQCEANKTKLSVLEALQSSHGAAEGRTYTEAELLHHATVNVYPCDKDFYRAAKMVIGQLIAANVLKVKP